jgi:glucose/mannose-6-phosphate isomerase
MLKPLLDRQSAFNIDKSNVYGSVVSLSEQLKHAYEQGRQIKLTAQHRGVDKVIVAGMGGSALGARVIKGFDTDLLKLPFEIVSDYQLPAWADAKTLVILSSYSGNTEEVLEVANQLKRSNALPIVIAAGGKLAQVAKQNHWPAIVFEPKFNPSNQPRMALGYNLGHLLSVLEEAGLVRLPADEISLIDQTLMAQAQRLGKEQPTNSNSAKQLAGTLRGKFAILIAGGHLRGAVYTFKNQLNENAKTFATAFDLPELDHHLLEGLGHPKSLTGSAHFVLFDSPLYSAQIAKRLALTEEVINKQGYGTTRIRTESTRPLAQAFETIQFGSFVSLYLALNNKLDPAPIPWVDYFKKKLT